MYALCSDILTISTLSLELCGYPKECCCQVKNSEEAFTGVSSKSIFHYWINNDFLIATKRNLWSQFRCILEHFNPISSGWKALLRSEIRNTWWQKKQTGRVKLPLALWMWEVHRWRRRQSRSLELEYLKNLFGRGGGINNHPGNIHFRQIDAYSSLTNLPQLCAKFLGGCILVTQFTILH